MASEANDKPVWLQDSQTKNPPREGLFERRKQLNKRQEEQAKEVVVEQRVATTEVLDIEQSLESLDIFKVTNLGRIN